MVCSKSEKTKILLFISLFTILIFIPQAYAFSFSDAGSVFSSVVGSVFDIFDVSGAPPVIVTAYLDKLKYMPGEQMIITAAVEDAESVKAYIETDIGVDEVDMVLVIGTKEKGMWQGLWILHDTTEREYFTRVVVSSSYGEAEEVLTWFDPTVSHTWSEITNIPAGFADGVDNVGGGVSNCELMTETVVDSGWSPGVHSVTASCPGTKKVTGGGCTFKNIYDADTSTHGYVFENRPLSDRSGWYCRTYTYLYPKATRISYAICCDE